MRHKKRVWQDRRKADWQEEDAHLRRASQELTKAVQVNLDDISMNMRRIVAFYSMVGPATTWMGLFGLFSSCRATGAHPGLSTATAQ